MKSSSASIFIIVSWIITLVVPVAISLGAVRVVLLPWYLQFEYHTPNFPADSFGFTLADRLHYTPHRTKLPAQRCRAILSSRLAFSSQGSRRRQNLANL